ncbi:MAG: magnesium transporter [Verrucomicrobiota bacterium]
MNAEKNITYKPVDSLNKAFMVNFPKDAARQLTTMSAKEAAQALLDQPVAVIAPVFEKLGHGVADAIFLELPEKNAIELLSRIDSAYSTALLSRLEEEQRIHYLSILDDALSKELNMLLEYPEDCAGRLMQTRVVTFNKNITVQEALLHLKSRKIASLNHLYLLDDNMKLDSQIDIQGLALAEGEQTLASISVPIKVYVEALDLKETVVEHLKKYRLDALPVVDFDHRLVGSIEGQGLIDALREDIATDMQTMVGVSKDERALSSSWFAVKKRLPWLQINLLTAFLAAAVVGAFEGVIAKYTALAILLPIAAGQSGNTGAQALAVTMRGLTLREITIRHWFRVTVKEVGAGLVNGVATAITCGLGVYLWSKSVGLALIIALAMISSMTIAAMAGALVPIGLKKIGQDPALSSSIILTTITDIAGFMSFLGIATLLSGMLEAA